MTIIVGPGIEIGGGITIASIEVPIGPTTSTATPTIFGGVTTAALTDISSPVSPFTVNCNSYNLNGTTGYMNLPASSDWAFGTGDFTVEWFQYMTATPTNPRIFSVGNYSSAAVAVSIEGGIFYVWEASGNRFASVLSGYTNTWIHFAISRIGNQTRVFRNGTQIGSTYTDNNNINNSSSVFAIGQESTPTSNSYFPGYITSFRVCKGVGVYSGNFTKPTTLLGQTQSANPYGGSNTSAITAGQCVLLLNP
jgi:hypothetical protein